MTNHLCGCARTNRPIDGVKWVCVRQFMWQRTKDKHFSFQLKISTENLLWCVKKKNEKTGEFCSFASVYGLTESGSLVEFDVAKNETATKIATREMWMLQWVHLFFVNSNSNGVCPKMIRNNSVWMVTLILAIETLLWCGFFACA